jgi:hypothetical protein
MCFAGRSWRRPLLSRYASGGAHGVLQELKDEGHFPDKKRTPASEPFRQPHLEPDAVAGDLTALEPTLHRHRLNLLT